MNNIIVQIVAISCCIFTVYTVLKSAYLGFQRMKKGEPSKDSINETQNTEKDSVLQKIEFRPMSDVDTGKFSKKGYKERFFTKLPLKYRSQTYIEKEYYDTLRHLLALVAPGTTTSSYLNLIVEDHLWRNRDLIRELLEDVKNKSL